LWSHNEPMYLMISPEGHNPMRAFIRETYT
jgi:hypothetical protein